MKAKARQWWIQWRKNLWAVTIYLIGVPLGAIGFFTLLFLKHRYGHSLYVEMFRFFGVNFARFLIGSFVMLAGLGATLFKLKNQMWYGMVEWIFGVCAGFAIAFSMSPAKGLSTQWVALIGCAYVIARGFNNMIEAGAKLDALKKTASNLSGHR